MASFSARGLNGEGEDVPGPRGSLREGTGQGGSGLGSLGHQCWDTRTGRPRPGRGAHSRVPFPESSWEWTRASGASVLEPCKHFSPSRMPGLVLGRPRHADSARSRSAGRRVLTLGSAATPVNKHLSNACGCARPGDTWAGVTQSSGRASSTRTRTRDVTSIAVLGSLREPESERRAAPEMPRRLRVRNEPGGRGAIDRNSLAVHTMWANAEPSEPDVRSRVRRGCGRRAGKETAVLPRVASVTGAARQGEAPLVGHGHCTGGFSVPHAPLSLARPSTLPAPLSGGVLAFCPSRFEWPDVVLPPGSFTRVHPPP